MLGFFYKHLSLLLLLALFPHCLEIGCFVWLLKACLYNSTLLMLGFLKSPLLVIFLSFHTLKYLPDDCIFNIANDVIDVIFCSKCNLVSALWQQLKLEVMSSFSFWKSLTSII